MRFRVPGEPVGKGRPRVVRRGGMVRTYTPDKTAAYEDLVRMECLRQCKGGGYFAGEPLRMRLVCYYLAPKSDTKARRAAKLNGEIRPTKTPDADNVAKCVCDALNGMAYRDDSQIVELVVEKYYSTIPHVDVEITKV